MKISEIVSVVSVFDGSRGKFAPRKVWWREREYVIRKIGLYHRYRQGNRLLHVFSAVSDSLFFRLVLDSETLVWRLEEIADDV